MQATQPIKDSADAPSIQNDNIDATGAVSLPSSNDKPTSADLRSAAEIPILSADGTSRPFQSLYANSSAPERVLIIFIRHFFCGSCQEYIRVLSHSIPPSALPPSTSILVVGCGQPSLIPKYTEMAGCAYPLYAEPTRKIYDILGMTSNLALGATKPRYLQKSTLVTTLQSIVRTVSAGRDALKGGDFKQIGGEFLFESGEVKWCHRMENTRDHAELEVLREVLGVEEEKKGGGEAGA